MFVTERKKPQCREHCSRLALKAAGLVESGVEAKIVIQNGEVLVNGRPELQRGKKLTGGEVISYNGQEIRIEK